MTCFILQAYKGIGVSHSQHMKMSGRGFGKKQQQTNKQTNKQNQKGVRVSLNKETRNVAPWMPISTLRQTTNKALNHVDKLLVEACQTTI